MTKELVVTVAPDGSISIDALGFKGKSCAEASAFLEKALGSMAERNKKMEYYQTAEPQRIQIGSGQK